MRTASTREPESRKTENSETDDNTSGSETQQPEHCLKLQQEAFSRAPLPSAEERRAHLDALERAIKTFSPALKAALDRDFGNRSHAETELAEIMPSIQAIRYTRKRLKRWMRPSRRHVSMLFQPAKARVEYQPLGVVGIIVPWNYPVFLALGPLISALAAGNRAMIKLSEYTPACNQVMRELLADCFAPEQVAVFEGEAEFSARFSALNFDHLLFTGSTAVGRHVMSAAASGLTPVTLELGGKSPVVLTQDYPTERAVSRILFGKTLNAGQTCVAPDYLLCHQEQMPSLLAALERQYQTMYPDFYHNPDVTGLIHNRHLQRIRSFLDEAEASGCQVVPLQPLPEVVSEDRRWPLCLVINPAVELSVMQEEIFGPVLPIISYQDEQEAIDFINQRPRPLALYLFSEKPDQQQRFTEQTHSGGLCLNDTLLHVAQDDLPFGGVGDSGIGHYHGKEGFLRLSHQKAVLAKGRLNSAALTYPPYRSLIVRIIRHFFGSGR